MTVGPRDNLIYSAAVVLPRLPAFLLLPVIASILSLEDMGKLASAWVFIELFQTVAGMGLKAALGRFFPMAREAGERREILTISLLGILGGGLALGLAAWAGFAWPWLRGQVHFLEAIDGRVFAALLTASMIGNLASTFIIYFRAEQKAWAFLAASTLGAAAELGLSLALLAAGRVSLLNLLLIECLKQAAMLVFIAHRGRRDWGFAFSRKTLKTLFAFGIWFVPLGLGEWLILSSDRFWLGQQGGLGQVGVYGFLYRFAMPLGILFAGSIMDLHAQLYRMPAAEGMGYTRGLADRYVVRSGLLMLAYAALFPLAFRGLNRFHPVFPAAYLGGLAAFPIMAAVIYVYYWSRYYGMALEFRFRPKVLAAGLVLAASASLILIPACIRLSLARGWNVPAGAAYGALATQLISLAFMARFAGLGGERVRVAKGLGFLAASLALANLLAWLG